MRSAPVFIACAALTLWLGGIVALFIFVQSLFANDRVLAVQAAPVLFRTFEIYQLILLAASVLGLVMWRVYAPARAVNWILGLALLAGATAVIHVAAISPRMRALADAGQSGGPEFRKLHGYSMIVFTSEAMILAAAACLLPAAVISSRSAMRETSPEIVEA